MDIDRDEILREFEMEAEEHLESMEQSLIALESRHDDEDLLRGLFRSTHTLKGAASCLGFSAMTQFAHDLEDFLERLWHRSIPVTPELVSLLLKAVDLWRVMVPKAMAGVDELPAEQVEILRALTRYAAMDRADLPPSGPAAAEELDSHGPRRARTLRVGVEQLDALVNLTGEIAIARSRMGTLLASAVAGHLEAIRDAHLESERLFLQLQEQVMKLRMVPVGPTFRQHVRTVRDVALASGKRARLVLAGEDVEIDMGVLEHLRDPLMHLVRNAIDHGIELPELRDERGKDPAGCITLQARYEAAQVEISVTDDGAGLDRERIRRRAVESGLLPQGAEPDEGELFKLIFAPGFSTAVEVTEISGRGIGLDIVSRNIEALRGGVTVASSPGVGTTVTMRVPLTLGIVQGFLVGVGAETYILPLESVAECIELPPGERDASRGRGIINLRGRVLPYLRLRDLFGVEGTPPARESVVVVHYADGQAGLAVDTLHGDSQTVVKPLARIFRNVPGVFGSALLGDGRVALILDVPGLMRQVVRKQAGAWPGSEFGALAAGAT